MRVPGARHAPRTVSARVVTRNARPIKAFRAIARRMCRRGAIDHVVRREAAALRDKALAALADFHRHGHAFADGVADVWGTITNPDERRAICIIAENTSGVKEVHDHLVFVEPYSGTVIEAPDEKP